jgi:6-pyruvoyltetrahydropterin/6-carboxytetrahydropterin synthase
MSEAYHVRIEKDYLVFSAAHFITYDGDVCERLHGHNYRLAAEVAGPLDQNHYVVDFVFLRETLRELVAELDHHVLLPTEHPQIRVTVHERSVEARFGDRRWEFPREDCVLLPVANTTAELLARHLAEKLRARLAGRGAAPQRLSVEVDECFGQIGVCTLDLRTA